MYNAHGIAYSENGEHDRATEVFDRAKAKADFTVATILRVDVSVLFHHFYESPKDFLQKTNIQIPADVAAMLIPQAELPEFEEDARLKLALKYVG